MKKNGLARKGNEKTKTKRNSCLEESSRNVSRLWDLPHVQCRLETAFFFNSFLLLRTPHLRVILEKWEENYITKISLLIDLFRSFRIPFAHSAANHKF